VDAINTKMRPVIFLLLLISSLSSGSSDSLDAPPGAGEVSLQSLIYNHGGPNATNRSLFEVLQASAPPSAVQPLMHCPVFSL
jgi:hypothetical protein